MGILCTSCCRPESSYNDLTPDAETRRKQLVEAAERRIAEQESHGIKNIQAVKRQKQLAMEKDKRMQEAGNMQATLKWNVN